MPWTQEPRAKSQEPRAKSLAKSQEPRAQSQEPRAGYKRAKTRAQLLQHMVVAKSQSQEAIRAKSSSKMHMEPNIHT
jgi:hypothetical protein